MAQATDRLSDDRLRHVYLFRDLFGSVSSASPKRHYVEHAAVDYYLALDRSKSIITAPYPEVESDLLQSIRVDVGDRLSCIGFATGTSPERVPAPMDFGECTADLRSRTLGFLENTRFDILFDRLHDRLQNVGPHSMEGRRNLVVVVSDGVPSEDERYWDCPAGFEEHGLPFIPQRVKDSLTRLLNGDTKPLVVLVLAGNRGPCVTDIQSHWRAAIDNPRFSVVDYADDAIGLIAAALGRSQPVRLEPRRALDESERRNLDAGKPFSAEFRAWSYFRGGSETFTHACLTSGDDDVARLRVFADCEDESPFALEVKAPAPGHPEGERSRTSACFVFENSSPSPPLSEMTTYVLHLDSQPAAVTYPLEIEPVPAKLRKARLLDRIVFAFGLVVLLFVVWLVVMFVVAVTAEPGGRRQQFNTRFIYHPRGDLFLAVDMLMINVCIAIGCVFYPLGPLFFTFPILRLVNGVKTSELRKTLLPLVEFVVLPLLEILVFWVAYHVGH